MPLSEDMVTELRKALGVIFLEANYIDRYSRPELNDKTRKALDRLKDHVAVALAMARPNRKIYPMKGKQ